MAMFPQKRLTRPAHPTQAQEMEVSLISGPRKTRPAPCKASLLTAGVSSKLALAQGVQSHILYPGGPPPTRHLPQADPAATPERTHISKGLSRCRGLALNKHS